MDWFEGFESADFAVPGGSIHARTGGPAGAPTLVLLHGFPQSHVMWHRVAQELRQHYFLVLPDLRGYGDAPKPVGEPDHANYSKRAPRSCPHRKNSRCPSRSINCTTSAAIARLL